MKTNALYLFASTCIILLASCKKDPAPITTTITGKVVTFGEDSLYHDGPIEISMYTSSSQWPNEHIETKTLYPPYDYRFVTEVNDPISDNFIVQLETDVPGHDRYYMHNYDWVNKGEDGEIMVELMPETAIRYELINEDGSSDKYISVVRIGGGQFQSFTTSTDYHIDEGWYNGEYPIRYFIVDKITGNTESFQDTAHLQPFETANHTIRF